MGARAWVWAGSLLVAAVAGCGYDSSPRMLTGDGFSVVTPGAWTRVAYPDPDRPGATLTVWTAGHGDSPLLVVLELPVRVAPGEVLSDPEFEGATDVHTGRLNGWVYVDAREPNLRIDTTIGQTAFVRKVFLPDRTVEVRNERPGSDTKSPSGDWPAFRDSLTITTSASPAPTATG